MSRIDVLRAELVLAETEEKLVAAKAAGEDISELKHQVREARAAHRAQREAAAPQPEEVSD
jgi:hypothetical protein